MSNTRGDFKLPAYPRWFKLLAMDDAVEDKQIAAGNIVLTIIKMYCNQIS